jgi:hypothetical protein
LRVHTLAFRGGPFPTSLQSPGYLIETMEKLAQVFCIERVHSELALAPPLRSLGGENARDPEVEHGIPHDLDAAKSAGPVTQDFINEIGSGESHGVATRQTKMIEGAKFGGPPGKNLMGSPDIDLQEVAEER